MDTDINKMSPKLIAKVTVQDECPLFEGIRLKSNAMPSPGTKNQSANPINLFNSRGEPLVHLTVVTGNDVPEGIEHAFEVSWKKYTEGIAKLETEGKPDTGAHAVLVSINP